MLEPRLGHLGIHERHQQSLQQDPLLSKEKTMDDKIAEMEEAMKQWEIERKADEEEADKNDDEMPNEEQMIEKELETLRT